MTTPAGLTLALATTVYGPVAHGPTSFNTVETTRQYIMPVGGSFSNLYVQLTTAQPVSGTLTLTVRINGAGTALTLVIPAGSAAGAYSFSGATVSVAAGDLVAMQIVNAATLTSATIQTYAFTLQ